ncbi:hypothetical protein SAMN04515647_2185 [Cohaesibacter sp. ES.047]|uniref:hypothetical protein n=1 Tax=Cohaesibacter sp. ES.047 TaxID=1798205 RepID=UPI000BB97766|nr:hypothetical protein [Cohaesibacter sp. ES.047]SNY91943.1 hypothetical protein SAMN04515647_2185 [Cohaesibacter sp. ES.047]
MIKALRYFWKEQPVALSALILALCVLVFFGARFAMSFIYFQDPTHRNETLQKWMTPKYVGMSYRLPRDVIHDVMQLEDFEGKRIKLEDVAERMGITLKELEQRVRAAKRAYEAGKTSGQQPQDESQTRPPAPASQSSLIDRPGNTPIQDRQAEQRESKA